MAGRSESDDILMAGFLCKRTKFTRKWKKFYWRLLSNGQLRRYKDIKQTKSLGQVDIKRNCYDIREGLATTSKITFPSYIPSSCCFSVSFTDKSYYMYAETTASAKEWVMALSNTSSIISRRRTETDARSRELERRRIALKNARQRRSRRNLPDTMSVDLVLECVEAGELDHLEGIEDPYVTILPPSPSHFKSQQNSTASLLRRSASVPDILNSNGNNNINDTNISAGSMTSLYDESEPDKPLPIRKPPSPPTRINKFEGKAKRRSSFSEDHPTLQRNTVLQQTRKSHKGYFASPQVTSSTFKVRPVDDMQLNTSSPPVEDRHTIHTGGSPTQSESSVGMVNVPQQSNITSPISPLSQYSVTRSSLHNTSSVPVKYFASNQKVTHRKSLADHALRQPNSDPNNSFIYPIPSQKPIFSFLTSGSNSPPNKQITGNLSQSVRQITKHQNSMPDLMAAQLTTTVGAPAIEKDGFSPPVVKRFTNAHHRCKSLSDLMPAASADDHQRKLHKVGVAIGGIRPQSMAAQQAIIAELQLHQN